MKKSHPRSHRNNTVCPFCHLALAPYDSEKLVLKFGDKKIPVKRSAFLNFCASKGLPTPPRSVAEFDAEAWLSKITDRALTSPLSEAELIMQAINEFTARLQMDADIAAAISSLSTHA